MSSSNVVSSIVNWNEIFSKNENDVINYAEGTLSFKNFKRKVNGDARSEVNKLERLHAADNRRNLARRACRRRRIAVSV